MPKDYKKMCDMLLHALLGNPELESKWWNTPNKAFNKLPPNTQSIVDVYYYLLGFYDK